MKIYLNPSRADWPELLQRPSLSGQELDKPVSDMLLNVKQKGDAALREYSERFDSVQLSEIQVNEEEIIRAQTELDEELKSAIKTAYRNIHAFHLNQKKDEAAIETTTGVRCWRKSVPIQKVGLYIPGGSAPLFSTVLMLGIPAQIAGCEEVILCTPPGKDLSIHPCILFAAHLTGIKKVYKVGGAQAIAAMAFGTESIPPVYKIFGPGNQFVTKAKQLVQMEGVAIDMPAGPSEVLVIADSSCQPEFVAADLLSQAEHGADSQVMLLTTDQIILQKCIEAVESQLRLLPRKELAAKALNNSKALLMNSMDDCLDFSNHYAPEHLIIASDKAEEYAQKVINAGSVFLGNYSCESAGDYASGTNHTLPTAGFARSYSGVSLDSFVKKITFQELSSQGIQQLGPAIELMAEAEGLFAHKNAVSLRLQYLKA